MFSYYERVRSISALGMSRVFAVTRLITHSMCQFAESDNTALYYDYKPSDEILKGAITFKTNPARTKHVASYDWKSQYTTAIIAYNISGESIIRRTSLLHTQLLKQYAECVKNKDFSDFNYYVTPYLDTVGMVGMDDSLVSTGLKHNPKAVQFFRKGSSFEKRYVKYMQDERYKFAAIDKDLEKSFKAYLNGIYGAKKAKGFFLGDTQQAQAITSVCRFQMVAARDYSNDTGRPVVLGDTDSFFAILKDTDKVICTECKKAIDFIGRTGTLLNCPHCSKKLSIFVPEIGEATTAYVRKMSAERFPCEDNWILLQFENFLKSILTVGKKKRYIGIRWDGSELIRGFEKMKINSNHLTKHSQQSTMDILLSDLSNEEAKIEVLKFGRQYKKDMKKLGYEKLCSTHPFARALDRYKAKGKYPAHIQAMLFSTKNFGMHFQVLEKFYVLEVVRTKIGKYNITGAKFTDERVAFTEIEDLPEDFAEYFKPNFKKLFKRDVVKKIESVVNVVGVSPKHFINKSMDEFMRRKK